MSAVRRREARFAALVAAAGLVCAGLTSSPASASIVGGGGGCNGTALQDVTMGLGYHMNGWWNWRGSGGAPNVGGAMNWQTGKYGYWSDRLKWNPSSQTVDESCVSDDPYGLIVDVYVWVPNYAANGVAHGWVQDADGTKHYFTVNEAWLYGWSLVAQVRPDVYFPGGNNVTVEPPSLSLTDQVSNSGCCWWVGASAAKFEYGLGTPWNM
jgi:hypothetical protein